MFPVRPRLSCSLSSTAMSTWNVTQSRCKRRDVKRQRAPLKTCQRHMRHPSDEVCPCVTRHQHKLLEPFMRSPRESTLAALISDFAQGNLVPAGRSSSCWNWYIPAAGLALVHDSSKVFQLLLSRRVAGAYVLEGKYTVCLGKDVESSGLQPKPSNARSRCNGLACSLVALKDGGETGP